MTSKKTPDNRRKMYRAIAKEMSRVRKTDTLPPIAKPGKVAGLLIEAFLDHGGDIKAATVENKGLCEKNGFTKWREPLIAKGWLRYDHGSYSRHLPGTLLLKHLNKYNSENSFLATKEDVDRVDHEVNRIDQNVGHHDTQIESIQKKLAEHEEMIKHIANIIDPPYEGRETEFKNNLKKGVYDRKFELIKNNAKSAVRNTNDIQIPFN